MAYTYQPPFAAAVGIALRGAYQRPFAAAVRIAFAPPGDAPVAGDVAYDTWRNTPLIVPAPGVLAAAADPAGQPLTAHLALAPTHGTLSLNADGSFGYIPDAGFVGVDAFAFIVRNADGLESDPAVATITVALIPATRYEYVAPALPWGRTTPIARAVAMGFAHAMRVARAAALPWSATDAIVAATALAWQRAQRVQRSTALAFALAPARLAQSSVLAWARPDRIQTQPVLPWSHAPSLGRAAAVPYSHPPVHQRAAELPWTHAPSRARAAAALYSHPPVRERRWWLPWRKAKPVQWHIRDGAVTPPDPEPAPPKYVPPFAAAVGLAFVCPRVDLPGHMIPLRFGAAACYFAHKRPRVYTVLNTAHVIAVATGQAIAVESIDITTSTDDMHHAFSIALADPADLQWLTPVAGDPIEIEININGHVWTAIVEEWTRDLAWPRASVRASGRSTSALLDAPYAPPRAYIETEERSAHQLADRELELTGFTADYAAVNWQVPGGAWHYDNATPAAALRTIAEASGSVARAHPWQRVIEIRPRWPVSPWLWGTTAADKSIHDDTVPRLAARNATSRAPVYEVQIPLWPSSAADKPGLLRVGQLVEFVSLDGWKAQVTAVRVAATLEDGGNGTRALVVWQTVTLEAPPAEPRFDYVLVSGEQVGVSDPVIRDGTAGMSRLPQIVDPLITEHTVAAERGRNALAGGADGAASSNLWQQLAGLMPASRYLKGNVTALNGDGSVTVATSDGATIRARPLPEQAWAVTDGVLVQDGRIIDRAPNLPGVTQFV